MTCKAIQIANRDEGALFYRGAAGHGGERRADGREFTGREGKRKWTDGVHHVINKV